MRYDFDSEDNGQTPGNDAPRVDGEYRYIPEQRDAWSDAGYVSSEDAAAVPKHYTCGGASGGEKKEKKAKKSRRGAPWAAVVALCLVCAILGGAAGGWGLMRLQTVKTDTAAPSETADRSVPDDTAAVAAIGGVTGPTSVVTNRAASSSEDLSPKDIYYDLAVNQVVGITSSITYNYYGRTASAQVSGSGFIISEDGYILTNCHVIEDAAESGGEITVLLYDGSEYSATVVGYDADNDIGVLKIDAEGLMPAVIGNSDDLQVGETVYVVGNALGYLEYSLTSGLVSGKDREINAYDSTNGRSNTLTTFQTEATINSGNSGGPVYNSRGEVVGVAVASASSSSYAESLNFAIPINTAITIAEDLIEDGAVIGKPYLGILNPSTLSASSAQYYGIVPGVYFEGVEDGSAAGKAGLKVGDIIVGLDDTEIATVQDLTAALRGYRVGDSATLRIYRSGEYRELRVTFEKEAPAATATQRQQQPSSGQQGGYDDFYDYFNYFFGGNPFGR